MHTTCTESGLAINQPATKMHGTHGGQMDTLGRVDMFKANDTCQCGIPVPARESETYPSARKVCPRPRPVSHGATGRRPAPAGRLSERPCSPYRPRRAPHRCVQCCLPPALFRGSALTGPTWQHHLIDPNRERRRVSGAGGMVKHNPRVPCFCETSRECSQRAAF